MAVACNKAQSTVDETFAHKKRRRALKQMQEIAADKDNNKGSSEQQQDNNNGSSGGGGATAGAQKTMVLPKKRPLAGQPTTGATTAAGQQMAVATTKKQAKASGDEAVDDETFIRETEAALKSLSGGWPVARHSFYRTGHDDDRYESPAFVNLFDEKKIGSGSGGHPPPPPSAPVATKVDENKNNTCDVKPTQQQQQPPLQQRRDLDHLLNKIDQNNKDCEHNKKPDKYAPSKYEPDFNELVDDSSDELEIDMSADGGGGGSGGGSGCSGGDDKCDGGDDDDDDDVDESGSGRDRGKGQNGGDRLRRKMDVDRRNNNSHVRPDEMMTSLKSESESSSYDAYLMDKTAFSAFRPVSSGIGEPKDPSRLDLPTAVGAAMSPLGPYPPAGATFVVGYTGPGGSLVSNVVGVSGLGVSGHGSPSKLSAVGNVVVGGGGVSSGGGGGGGGGSVTPVKPVCVKLEDDGCGAADKTDGAVIKMDSPSPLSKQYTILQPAGADSRAATALQDVAREGVLGASVVSAAGGGMSPRMASGGGTPKLLLDPVDGGLMLAGCMNNKGERD